MSPWGPGPPPQAPSSARCWQRLRLRRCRLQAPSSARCSWLHAPLRPQRLGCGSGVHSPSE
eukprot:14943911-Alexandrium_andersonii.AAC.1